MALIEHRQRVKFLRFPPIALLRLAGPDRFPAVLAFFEAGVGHPPAGLHANAADG